jgi:hypothetical protein
MVLRAPPVPTPRERRVWALAPLPTVYLILKLRRPSVSKASDVPRALDVPRRRAAEIRRRTMADGGSTMAPDTAGASSSAAEVMETWTR